MYLDEIFLSFALESLKFASYFKKKTLLNVHYW